LAIEKYQNLLFEKIKAQISEWFDLNNSFQKSEVASQEKDSSGSH
jgi:hypothetical protein